MTSVDRLLDVDGQRIHYEIVTMPGLGHYPSDEKPAEFVAVVKRFLAAR